ncbi:hypothetical protein KA183_11960 [bacterium]|nr:hypothetical protein [bacterium]QQR57087.1 MAG: hypothetical protein IPG59_19190 [Candidatus Melainabacteria bacterium]
MKFANMLAASMVLAVAGLSLDMQPAHAWKHGVNNRQQRQQARIQRGAQYGSLTPVEARRLSNQQNALAAQEARFRASGNGLNSWERSKLQHEQNQLSQNIHRQSTDRQGTIMPPVGNPPIVVNPPTYNPPGRPGLYNVNQNQLNQQQRMYQGIQSGELTGHEAQRLAIQQQRFAATEASMRQDGLTLNERRKLDHMQDSMSRNIYNQKHDAQDR